MRIQGLGKDSWYDDGDNERLASHRQDLRAPVPQKFTKTVQENRREMNSPLEDCSPAAGFLCAVLSIKIIKEKKMKINRDKLGHLYV